MHLFLKPFYVVLICLSALAADRGVHPGYDLVELWNESEVLHGVGDLDFLSDGRLVLVEWGGHKLQQGKVHLMTGVTGDNLNNITRTEIASGLYEPLGVKVVNDEIYFVEREFLKKINGLEAGGTPQISTIYTGWSYVEGDYQWADGLDYDGTNFYTHLNGSPGGQGDPDNNTFVHYPADHDRGSVISISATGDSHGRFASGIRTGDGLYKDYAGSLWITEAQGFWAPASKLLRLEKDTFYGYVRAPDQGTGNIVPPPVAWIPHAEAGQSPSQPVTVPSGIYQGHILVGDTFYGGIKRYSVERVNGIYQASIHEFCEPGIPFDEGLAAGVHRLAFGPDGDLYIGGLGSQQRGDWAWQGTYFGLQKMTANATVPFEMLAVRSIADGFEIEFTQPAGDEAASTANYTVQTWTYSPTLNYGGGKVDNKSLTVASATLSTDARKVTLNIPGITEGYVVNIKLPAVKSATGEDLWGSETWYTLNSLGPADVKGCMDATYLDFNPLAVYDDGLSCITRDPNAGVNERNAPWNSSFIRLHSRAGTGISIETTFTGCYKMEIRNTAGRLVKTIRGNGPGHHHLLNSSAEPGMYLVTVSTAKNKWNKKIVQY